MGQQPAPKETSSKRLDDPMLQADHKQEQPGYDTVGIIYGIGMGLMMALGGVGFMLSCSADQSKESAIAMLTSLYPLISTFLSRLILKEQLSYKQYLGICLALLGAAFVST